MILPPTASVPWIVFQQNFCNTIPANKSFPTNKSRTDLAATTYTYIFVRRVHVVMIYFLKQLVGTSQNRKNAVLVLPCMRLAMLFLPMCWYTWISIYILPMVYTNKGKLNGGLDNFLPI